MKSSDHSSPLVVTVLKAGPEYGLAEAMFLHNQLKDYDAVCLTDIPQIPGVCTLPLMRNYPGWWSKLELFDPKGPLAGRDLFYLDIDTLITGDLSGLIYDRQRAGKMTMLTDFYNEQVVTRPPASGVMYIPDNVKEIVWERWLAYGPEKAMADFVQPPRGGDQGFIGHVLPNTDRWQDVAPREIISYKKDVAAKGMAGFHNLRSKGDGKIPAQTKIVCFHGKPRPWQVDYQQLLNDRSELTA